MARLVHSYSTRPLRINRYDLSVDHLGNTVWYFALSVAYAKRIGGQIVLHTDTLGKALLGHLPYDEIHLTLDEIPESWHPRFWASGKFYSLAYEPLGAIHIDGDVFFKEASLLDKFNGYDVVVQDFEEGQWYEAERKFFRSLVGGIEHLGLNIDHMGALNTGTFCMNNAEYKRRYLDGYFRFVETISKYNSLALDARVYGTPDLIVEQQWADQLAKEMGVKVGYLLKGGDGRKESAKAIGYQHVLTSAKFCVMDRVRNTLHKINEDIYNQTEKLCRNISKK